MKRPTSRRDFLEISALGLAAAAVPGSLASSASAATEAEPPAAPANPEISGWTTSGQERFAAVPKLSWNEASTAARYRSYSPEPGQKIPVDLGLRRRFHRCDLLYLQPPRSGLARAAIS